MKPEIIIPYYNEAHRLEDAVRVLAAVYAQVSRTSNRYEGLRFWWVDDGSTDGSSETLKALLARYFSTQVSHEILRYERNRGKGSAMRYAIEHLRTKVHPQISPLSVVAFWDSDGELDPRGLFEAIDIVQSGHADIAFGSRFSKRNAQVLNFRHYIGNKALTLLSNWFSNLNLSDVHCCAKMMRAETLFQLPLTARGFDFEAEFAGIVGRVRAPRLRLTEVPILYTPRTVDEGKKINFRHVWPQLTAAIRCRYFHKPIHLKLTLQASEASYLFESAQ